MNKRPDGNPYTANLNIETRYRVNANPKSILESITTSRDIPIDLIARFTGELYDSTKEYDILIPDAGSDLNSELDFKINQNNDEIETANTILAIGLLIKQSKEIFENYHIEMMSCKVFL